MNTLIFLAEWALRSSILILGGAALLLAMRVKDPAIRLAAWTAMLCGSLLIPFMTAALPGVQLRVARPAVLAVAVPVVLEEMTPATLGPATSQPVAAARPVQPKPAPIDWARAAVLLYVAVALAMLLRLCLGLLMSRRFLRRARSTGESGIRESDRVSTPATVGIIHPVIVVPANWRDWEPAKLEAVLAHEQSHIGRYDPAVQCVSAIHRAILWFSPLSWFLHTRVVRVAEEASDDAAVTATGDRVVYAEVLMDFIEQARPEFHAVGVSMARYGSPVERIHRVLDATSLSRGVTRWSVFAILVLGAPLAYLAASARPQDVPVPALPTVRRAIADLPRIVEIPHDMPTAPQIVAQAAPPPPPAPPPAPPAPPAAPRPKFSVASIKPCDPNTAAPGGRSGPAATSRFRRNCVTIMTLIPDAYIRFADGIGRSPMLTTLTKIEGGPAWLSSDQYTIEAETEGTFTPQMMIGPLTQTLLEDRFQLKLHRETREGPIYELVAAKGGAKIQPAKVGPCVAADFVGVNMPFPPRLDDTRQCNLVWTTRSGPNTKMIARSMSMQDFAASLTNITGRLVVDKTGITGTVDYHLTFAPDDSMPKLRTAEPADGVPVPDEPAGASLYTALQDQLGLKLESAKGPREYLVIDSVSRPTPN